MNTLESYPDATECLSRAMRARDAEIRKGYASAGLTVKNDTNEDTKGMLLRQLYLAHFELGEFTQAEDAAKRMMALGILPDIALQDLACVRHALGDQKGVIAAYRQAVRQGPPSRRSFHLFCLATAYEHAGQPEEALDVLSKARRWSNRNDLTMIAALEAFICLESELPVPNLEEMLRDLLQSPSIGGYGGYLMGMISFHIGDRQHAETHLRRFLRRHASAAGAQRVSLRTELDRARKALRTISQSQH